MEHAADATAAVQYAQLNATQRAAIDAQLRFSVDTLAAGMRCIDRSLMQWSRASRSAQLAEGQHARAGAKQAGARAPRRSAALPHSKVMQTVGGSEVLPRSISLRAAACSDCRWASYTAESRYEKEHTPRGV
eukprot:11004-Prymnesium_polylepis.1